MLFPFWQPTYAPLSTESNPCQSSPKSCSFLCCWCCFIPCRMKAGLFSSFSLVTSWEPFHEAWVIKKEVVKAGWPLKLYLQFSHTWIVACTKWLHNSSESLRTETVIWSAWVRSKSIKVGHASGKPSGSLAPFLYCCAFLFTSWMHKYRSKHRLDLPIPRR